MNTTLLRKHIERYVTKLQENKTKHEDDLAERAQRKEHYKSWTAERILAMTEEEIYTYLSQLWAMRIWGNKRYIVEKIIRDNGLDSFRRSLADLVWGSESIAKRWDVFRNAVTHMGPAMISEILCHTHSDRCMLWNRRAYVGFRYLGVEGLPRYDYQFTGKKYEQLSGVALDIASEMERLGAHNVDLLTVDYFLWDELQVEETLADVFRSEKKGGGANQLSEVPEAEVQESEAKFVHNEIRDKLADIGLWLGFRTDTEVKVADGSKVDTVWEATIGNMGKAIYVFEVQTRGSIDSLIVNLLKSLNNPAVQGVVAVSDLTQLETIKKHASMVQGLGDKLKYWDYQEVVRVHDALHSVNEAINRLNLVPESF